MRFSNISETKPFMKKIIKKNQQATKTETGERFAIINDKNEIEVYSRESDRLIRKVKMPDKESAIRRLKSALYEPDLGTFRGKQMWYSNKEPGLRFSEIDKELEEVSNYIPNEETDDTRMGTITVKTDAERKKRAQMYRDKKAKEVNECDYARPVLEEVEQIDELKKSTLASYVKKASGDMAGKTAIAVAKVSSSNSKPDPDLKRGLVNRIKGINRAADKLAKEEVNECDYATGETVKEQLLDMLENAMISIEQDLERGQLLDSHAMSLGESYLVYEALYNKVASNENLDESLQLDEVDWGTVGTVAMTAAPLLLGPVGAGGALAGLAGRAALGALAKRGGMALAKRGLQKVAPRLAQRLSGTRIGKALAGAVGNTAATTAFSKDAPEVDRPDTDATPSQDLLGLAAQSGLSSADLDLVKRVADRRK